MNECKILFSSRFNAKKRQYDGRMQKREVREQISMFMNKKNRFSSQERFSSQKKCRHKDINSSCWSQLDLKLRRSSDKRDHPFMKISWVTNDKSVH